MAKTVAGVGWLDALGAWVMAFPGRVGPLRMAMLIGAALTLLLAPPADGQLIHEGWGLFLTFILPAMAPLFLAGLLLDCLMSLIYMSGQGREERARLGFIIRVNLVMSALLLLVWVPFILAVLL